MSILRFCVRYLYVPLMMLGFNGFAIWMVGTGYNWWWLALIFLGAVFFSLIVERILPYHSGFNRSMGDVDRDILHALVLELSVINSVILLPFIAMLRPWESLWPHDWPLWQQVILAVFLADFGFMFVHFLAHRLAFLWPFHAPHHSVERVYSFNGLIKHPIQITVEIIIGSIPLIMLGISQEIALLVGFAAGIQLLLQHSNADYELGPFTHVFAIAPVHRFHHLKDPVKGDVNFGLFLTLWDHLFRTFKYDPNERFQPGDFGIGSAPDYPKSWGMHMIMPFIKKRKKSIESPEAHPAE